MDPAADKLTRANQSLKAGDLADAGWLADELLAAYPQHAEVLRLAALVAYQQGDLPRCEALARRGVELQPEQARLHELLGLALKGQGQLAVAVRSLQRALRLAPHDAVIPFNLGNAWRLQGNWQKATEAYLHALRCDSRHVEAGYNLGLVWARQGRQRAAEKCFRQALAIDASRSDIRGQLAFALAAQGQLEEAETTFQLALRGAPRDVSLLVGLARVCSAEGQPRRALATIRQALDIEPQRAGSWRLLGDLWLDQAQLDQALEAYQRAAELDGRSGDHAAGLVEQVVDAALARCDQRIRENPDDARARYHRGQLWLLQGDYQRGWRECEWRWQMPAFVVRRSELELPVWEGQPLGGQTILLTCEQGVGELLQFVRYARLLQAQGARVVLSCPAEWVGLLEMAQGVDEVAAAEEPSPPCDLQASLASLPHWLATTAIDKIPTEIPYLVPGPDRQQAWQDRLAAYPGLKVGLAWPTAGDDEAKVEQVDLFAALADVVGAHCFTFARSGERGSSQPAACVPIDSLLPPSEPPAGALVHTAAAIACLDLVITSEPTVAQVAGAVGRPAWVALKYLPHWRWQLGTDRTPWYPTLRLFRQPAVGDWSSVFQQLAARLRQLAAQQSEPG